MSSLKMFVRIALVVVASFARGAAPPAATAVSEVLARGKYLVTITGCNDCHTPLKMTPAGPAPDMDRMLSGHPEQLEMPAAPVLPAGPWLVSVGATNTAWSGPWGVTFTANLTPDRETGLGKWNVRTFTDTIRTGRHLGRGREILPPMPIPMYKHFTDSDLAAIFSYLQSIPAVKNKVPEPRPPATLAAANP
ncbi:MAG: diheme cytochrome c-553 [Pseudomonadota bacterium]